MTSPFDINPNSVNISTQTIGETIYLFSDLPGIPIQEKRIIRTQDDRVKKALIDLGWVCPQEAKAMEMRYSRLGNENLQLRADLNKMTDERNAWRTGHTDRTHEADKMRGELEAMRSELESTRKGWKELADLKRGGVVVPDITDEDFESISVLTHETGIGCHDSDNDSFRRIVASTWAYAQGAFVDISRLRPISADRVLGAGKVAVDREELCLLRQLESGWREPYDLSAGERARIITRLDALRTQPTLEPKGSMATDQSKEVP